MKIHCMEFLRSFFLLKELEKKSDEYEPMRVAQETVQ